MEPRKIVDKNGYTVKLESNVAFATVSLKQPSRKILDMLGVRTGQITTPLFWDCECEEDFIHPRHKIKCDKCGKERWDQPDSRYIEVIAAIVLDSQ
jgi:hypothetical protein